MIYLIGGPPRCGKSTVARRLQAQTHASWVPADYLTTVISGYIPEDERPQRLPILPGTPNNDLRYQLSDAATVIQHYRTKAGTSWQAIQDVAEYALADEHDMILEGYQVEPRFVRAWLTVTPNLPCKVLFLYREDAEDISNGLQHSTVPNDWVRRNTHEAGTFPKIAAMIALYSRIFREEAAMYGLPAYQMDGAFEVRVAGALACLAPGEA